MSGRDLLNLIILFLSENPLFVLACLVQYILLNLVYFVERAWSNRHLVRGISNLAHLVGGPWLSWSGLVHLARLVLSTISHLVLPSALACLVTLVQGVCSSQDSDLTRRFFLPSLPSNPSRFTAATAWTGYQTTIGLPGFGMRFYVHGSNDCW
jgi:hypothetical protein